MSNTNFNGRKTIGLVLERVYSLTCYEGPEGSSLNEKCLSTRSFWTKVDHVDEDVPLGRRDKRIHPFYNGVFRVCKEGGVKIHINRGEREIEEYNTIKFGSNGERTLGL